MRGVATVRGARHGEGGAARHGEVAWHSGGRKEGGAQKRGGDDRVSHPLEAIVGARVGGGEEGPIHRDRAQVAARADDARDDAERGARDLRRWTERRGGLGRV